MFAFLDFTSPVSRVEGFRKLVRAWLLGRQQGNESMMESVFQRVRVRLLQSTSP